MPARPDPDDGVPWGAYAESLIHVRAPAGWVTFVPRPADDGGQGPWPFPGHDAVHVVTAYNPMSRPRSQAENAAAQWSLVQEALDRGWAVWDAVNAAADGSHAEPSLVLLGARGRDVGELAERYGQGGVYVLTPHAVESRRCPDGAVMARRGWRLESPAPGDPRG